MSQIITSWKSQAFDFNFLQTGGLIGTINLGVHIPTFSWIVGFFVNELTAVTSAGGATISFGTITTDQLVPVSTVNNLMVATAIAGFTAQPLRGVDLYATPLRVLTTVDITMSIAAFDLTGGRLNGVVWYQEMLQ